MSMVANDAEPTTILSSSNQQFVVMGGGPVGCYLAFKLLEQKTAKVIMFEGRKFERPQVIRIPYAIANDLPSIIKNKMWNDEETTKRIFGAGDVTDMDFWPRPGYRYWPWISIGLFQETLIDFLKTDPYYQDRFFFIPNANDITTLDLQAEIQNEYPHSDWAIKQTSDAIFCTCGSYAKGLREKANLLAGKSTETKGPGIYLIYQNETTESYLRNGKPISYSDLGEKGISYAAANNSNKDVQIYTYPGGELFLIFEQIPESFIQHSQYSVTNDLNMTGYGLPEDAKSWFNQYKAVVLAEMFKADIPLPADLAKIKVFYAQRTEYYWNRVVTKIRLKTEQIDTPLFFVGDSAGSTDYKLGLSMGRGLLSVQELVKYQQTNLYDFTKVALDYQVYWSTVIASEFNKGPTLTLEPWIQYQYLVKGREVNFHQDKLSFLSDNDYANYLDEYQYLFPDFAATSEASATVYINIKAIQKNITNIIDLGKKLCGSKIIGVVKSDGYGLGAKLISQLAIDAGIDFLATAKLREAVALRNLSFAKKARIIVFDAPLAHDLSTYAAHQIEIILPASKAGDSITILHKWLEKSYLAKFPTLKVHIMIDTGMRRDGGLINNLPESVLQTITAIQRLAKDKIEFAGLATHLSCYRCTDYNGEEVVDFRILQLQRLHEVVSYLFANDIYIPLIHVGGGLGLLTEHWPKQFADITQQYGTQLYTRVGHGIYGMELESDLNPASPEQHAVVAMNLQVRNVFHVEAGEPVSYGGHWRAPTDGAWIATLSGGWNEGIPRTAKTLGSSDTSIMVSINGKQYPVVGTINMNAMMVNLGSKTTVKPGDRVIIFGWKTHEPKLSELAQLSGQISPSIMVNIPWFIPRIVVSE